MNDDDDEKLPSPKQFLPKKFKFLKNPGRVSTKNFDQFREKLKAA